MKKLLSSFIALSCIVSGLCSCSENSPSDSSEKISRVSTAPLDEALIGTWMNDYNGYRFGENRKISLVVDFSERAHFTADGEFQTASTTISKENVAYDGSMITVTHSAYDENYGCDMTSILLSMARLDEPNSETFDGYYQIYGGVLADTIANELGFVSEDFNFEGKIEGESLIIYMIDCFDYETVDGKLDIFSDLFNYVDENADAISYSYTIDGETLSMKLDSVDNAENETYKKVNE